MIYIKNNTEIQTIFIPRSELQKEAYIASTKTYEDGYKEGFGMGKQYQKDQLLNLYATENGEYVREDGWGIVTVDIPIVECPDCPEGGSCNLGEGEIYLTASDAGFYELFAADDGYDGWSKFYVTLENGGAIKIHKAEELIQMFNEGWGIDFGTYYYVGGKITEIQEVNTKYGNATYTLDNGFSVYRGKWTNGDTFTSEDQIKVGAYIVAYGVIADYRGTLQFNAGSQVIAYQECEGGEISCNLIKEEITLKGEYEQFLASDYGADGFECVTINAYDYGKQKFNEGYEEGKNQGGTVTTYSTIREVYNTEDVTIQVSCKGTVAVCLSGGSSYYMIVTDHTGAIYVTAKQPYDVGDECFLAGVVRKTNSTNMRYMSNPIIEVLSKGNYVVMPTDAVELTNKDELYVPNEYGNAEMKYLYYQGEVQKIASNGNITIITPESVSAEGQITLRAAKEEWRSNLVIGDYIRMYMFTTNGDGFFLPTDIIKLGTEGGCNLEDKWVTPSMADRDGNGYIVVGPSEGYDGLERVVFDPTTIYNEGVAAGGDCNLINPIFFCGTEGNTINAEGVEIPIFVYEGNQHYNVWPLYMAEYEEFKIQLRFQANNGGYGEPVNIFGCEDTDWDDTTFGARIYEGQIYFRMSGGDVSYPYSDYVWYDVEMGYNSSKRWIIVNGETLFENDHSFFNKPSQNLMMGAINSGGNAFRPFYGKIGAAYIEANGSQVWLLPKEEGQMDVYWNDRSSPWVSLNGESNARFESDWLSGDGMKSITWLGKRVSCPSAQEQITDYIYNQVTLYSYRNIGFDDFEGCFYDSNNEPITDVLIVCKKVDFEYSFKLFTKVPIKTCSKVPYPNNPLYGLTRLYFKSIPSVNLNYKDNNVLYLYIEDVDYLNMNGATLNGLLRIWLKGTTTFSQGLEIGTAQIKDSGTVYSDGTNTDKISSSFSTWTIINDHKLP